MNVLRGSGNKLLLRHQLSLDTISSVRHASKKASGGTGGNKNPKQAGGKNRRIWRGEGCYVNETDTIATQNRLQWHGGLNVGTIARFTLVALTEGRVIFTCEKPDLDFSHSWTQKFYSGREGQPMYKKYVHVIPRPIHNRFKLIEQI